jgi:GrpB-like predicted nucleotidyltransferase (UPF0157 family)
VIDIQISVASLERRDRYDGPLEQLGYVHIAFGDFDRVYPFFQKPATWPTSYHVHLCVQGSEQERVHLAFRDYLRDHPAIAADYLALKRRLAAAHDGLTLESRERYSLAKTGFVQGVLERALAAGYPVAPLEST